MNYLFSVFVVKEIKRLFNRACNRDYCIELIAGKCKYLCYPAGCKKHKQCRGVVLSYIDDVIKSGGDR